MTSAVGLSALTWACGVAASASAPVLTSADYDLVDTAGGDTIVLTGTDLALVTSASWGGTACTVVDTTATTVTLTMPAKAAGSYGLTVTSPGGTSGALSVEAWSPQDATSATCIHRWRPDQGVTESGGLVSVLEDLVGAMHQRQTLGDATKPMLVASDDDYGGQAVLSSPDTGRSLVGDTVSAIARPTTMLVVGDANTGSIYGFIGNPASPYNMLWRTGGNQLQWFSPGAFNCPFPNPTDPHAMLVHDDGSTCSIFVDDLVTPGASDATKLWSTVTSINLMDGVAGVENLKGRLAEVCIWSGALDADDRARLERYCAVRYGLAA